MSLASPHLPVDLETTPGPSPTSRRGEFTWELATMYPRQGEWTEAEYLALETNSLIEFNNGMLEFLPMVTPLHQDLVLFLRDQLKLATRGRHPGRVYVAPLRVRIKNGKYREPDVIFARPEHISDRRKPLIGADLVVEIVSGSSTDRERDYVTKRNEYAESSVREYWIVDPDSATITVLTLPDGENRYQIHGEFERGAIATSALIPEFAINVNHCFDAGNDPASD